ncbi:helix-turn-helix domain-containing protein [Streptococcus mutans]|nr:helix-turn-helix domain-containing protein [Streptococcus mutans]MCB5028016.1 helix-turn-helix domain-containing protein [Streptococcus mutans]MCB5030026.1 helix-turn-helix domain-containing protein [Streptococcus mutans]
MNAKELAVVLGLHPDSIRRLINQGEIKATKQGREWIIGNDEVERLRIKYLDEYKGKQQELENAKHLVIESLQIQLDSVKRSFAELFDSIGSSDHGREIDIVHDIALLESTINTVKSISVQHKKQ